MTPDDHKVHSRYRAGTTQPAMQFRMAHEKCHLSKSKQGASDERFRG